MPCRLSVPIAMRCQTMKATPTMPSSSPTTLRQVSALVEQQRGQTAVNTGLALTISAAEAGRDGLQPDVAEAEIERVVGDAEHREDRDVAPGSASSASPRSADKPRIRTPASENRAVSRISGGQSVTATLPATKAKLHSRQNSAI